MLEVAVAGFNGDVEVGVDNLNCKTKQVKKSKK